MPGRPEKPETAICARPLPRPMATARRRPNHPVTTLTLATMGFDLLRDPADFATAPPADILKAQQAVTDANHCVIIYPLWLGTMPALVKAFFEQLSRNEFAIEQSGEGWPRKMLKGRSAHVIITMGMPATAYEVFFGAHGLKAFESGILGMAGFKPIRDTLIGRVETMKPREYQALFDRMERYGRDAR